MTKTVEQKMQETEHDGVRERLSKNKMLVIGVIILFIIGTICAGVYYYMESGRIYVEDSSIEAPVITLSPQSSGVLDRLLASEGDTVSEREAVAEIAGQKLRTKSSGIIVSVQNTPGQIVTSQTSLVKMIDPKELRVIGRVPEDKGLKDIGPGQKAVFTVDAFGSKKYEGVVELVSPTSSTSDIVFSISDQRQVQDFLVKVRFDTDAYPELKNGMSAKLYIYK
jgi:multidrug resistance efflux pump